MQVQSQTLQEQVHHLFREFGRTSCLMISHEIIRRGSLAEILSAVGLPDPGYNQDRLSVLLNYVRRHGVTELMRRSNPHGEFVQPRPVRSGSGEKRRPLPVAKNDESDSTDQITVQKHDPESLHSTWDGTERRKPSDRRQGERRQQVELIFHNSRYEGERRAGRDRRRNWPPDKQN